MCSHSEGRKSFPHPSFAQLSRSVQYSDEILGAPSEPVVVIPTIEEKRKMTEPRKERKDSTGTADTRGLTGGLGDPSRGLPQGAQLGDRLII